MNQSFFEFYLLNVDQSKIMNPHDFKFAIVAFFFIFFLWFLTVLMSPSIPSSYALLVVTKPEIRPKKKLTPEKIANRSVVGRIESKRLS